MRNRLLVTFTALILLAPVSCSKSVKGIDALSFEAASVISAQNRIALVVDPYISLRDKAGDDGITVAHGRRGEIYEISGVELVDSTEDHVTWYNLGNGWVTASSIRVFSDRNKAKTASKELY